MRNNNNNKKNLTYFLLQKNFQNRFFFLVFGTTFCKTIAISKIEKDR